ncbi:MAG: cysteine desulfurase family protein [Gemmatimonadales bacterium]
MDSVVYLDNAATTPVRPEVREAMAPFLCEDEFGNPSSPHRFGRAARAALDEARQGIAAALGARQREVFFTSGGTEADNLAVLGAALAARTRGRAFRVAVGATEHKAVLAAGHQVEELGGEAITLPVDPSGAVDPAAVDDVLRHDVAVLSVMWVNNEVGTVQNAERLAQVCAEAGTLYHVDAVQAIGKIPCSATDVPHACMSISGHKIGAPKGIGALIIPDRDKIHPLIHGGGQQYGVRPGTENVAGAVGLGVAVQLAVAERASVAADISVLRNTLELGLSERISDLVVMGSDGRRAPHISNIIFPGTDSGSLLMHLDQANICCSAGSACSSGSVSPSHVLVAMGASPDLASATVRFSFSHTNTPSDVERVLEAMPGIVGRVRDLHEVAGT